MVPPGDRRPLRPQPGHSATHKTGGDAVPAIIRVSAGGEGVPPLWKRPFLLEDFPERFESIAVSEVEPFVCTNSTLQVRGLVDLKNYGADGVPHAVREQLIRYLAQHL